MNNKKETYKRSNKNFNTPYLLYPSRGICGRIATDESPMMQYNTEVKVEDDVFGWGEVEVPAKKVFMCVNTFAYQGDGPCVQFMCGWKDFEVNGFSEEDYYHCMMYLEETESMVVDCDYEGVVIMCVAANSHMAYIKKKLDEIKTYTIPYKFCGTKLTEEEWDKTAKHGRRDWKNLKIILMGMDFDTALSELKGYNVENDAFDYNYETIAVTIMRGKDNKCVVSNKAEVWVDPMTDLGHKFDFFDGTNQDSCNQIYRGRNIHYGIIFWD